MNNPTPEKLILDALLKSGSLARTDEAARGIANFEDVILGLRARGLKFDIQQEVGHDTFGTALVIRRYYLEPDSAAAAKTLQGWSNS